MGGTGKSWGKKIQKFQKGYRGGMMCCVTQIMAETSNSLGAARYQLSTKVKSPYCHTFYI